MFKRIVLWIFLVVAITAAIAAWKILGPATTFSEKSKYLFIPSNAANKQTIQKLIASGEFIKSSGTFNFLAERLDYWKKIKAGRYEIKKNMSVLDIVRMLKNGRQAPVNLVINKFRTKEDFARFAGKQLECDSAAIMNYFLNKDSLKKFDLDTNTVMTAVIPNTYTFFWDIDESKLFKRLYSEQEEFWTKERRDKANALGLSPKEVYTLASIVEEETNKNDEKPLVASVYLNRRNKNMTLGADPTVKYALRDFGLKRIYLKHINEAGSSPYNTYLQRGFPPGPICTPSIKTIDAVLEMPSTDYLYFCAKPDFSGYHVFASNDKEHMKNAKAYQHALDSLLIK